MQVCIHRVHGRSYFGGEAGSCLVRTTVAASMKHLDNCTLDTGSFEARTGVIDANLTCTYLIVPCDSRVITTVKASRSRCFQSE